MIFSQQRNKEEEKKKQLLEPSPEVGIVIVCNIVGNFLVGNSKLEDTSQLEV